MALSDQDVRWLLNEQIGPLKSVAWEDAKGKLRAVAALSGAGHDRSPNFREVSAAVEKFIADFEDNGLHE